MPGCEIEKSIIMPEHKLVLGKKIIQLLTDVGKILGYCVKQEYNIKHVDNKITENQSAVDLTWFLDKEQIFPLFIFEIESTATNSMTFNPMKVFSQSTDKFEKPLFLFQLVITGGDNSSRVEALKNEYGKHNYRIYLISSSGFLPVLKDIISQHRRLSLSLRIKKLLLLMIDYSFNDNDISNLCEFIEGLNFIKSIQDLLPTYCDLYLIKKIFLKIYNNYLSKEIHNEENGYKIARYETYFGLQWSFPIHKGILAYNSSNICEKEKHFNDFCKWQENYSYLSMIGPHFGLNYDYDQFIIWFSGGILCLLSILFKDIISSTKYFCELLKSIIIKTKPPYSFLNLIILFHMANLNKDNLEYKNFVLSEFKLNNISYDLLLSDPPGIIDDFEWISNYILNDSDTNNMTIDEIKNNINKGISKIEKEDVLDLTFRILNDLTLEKFPYKNIIRQIY
jgi:hypothetical protein